MKRTKVNIWFYDCNGTGISVGVVLNSQDGSTQEVMPVFELGKAAVEAGLRMEFDKKQVVEEIEL